MSKSNPSLTIVDGYSFVFRAYYSLPPLTSKEGLPVGAVYGFANMLYKLWNDSNTDFFAVVFDAGKITFRSEIYPLYKANRPEAPEDLKPQFPLFREVTEIMNISALEKTGVEADDIIATLVETHQDMEITIYSGDKDLMQLVDDRVKLYDPIRKKTFGTEEVKEKFGVLPTQLLDYLSLVGDSSDNIPGVPSIGAKTASQLLNEFSNLDNIYANLENISQTKRRNALEQNKELAYLSKKLATLKKDVDLDISKEIITKHDVDLEKFTEFCHKYNFKSLLNKLDHKVENTAHNKGPETITKHHSINRKEDLEILNQIDFAEKIFLHICNSKTKTLHIFSNTDSYSIPLNEAKEDLFADHKQISLIDLKPFLSLIYNDRSISKICLNLKRIMQILITLDIINIQNLNTTSPNLNILDLETLDYLLDKNDEYYLDLKNTIDLLDKGKIEFAEIATDINKKYPSILRSLQKNKLLDVYFSLDLPTLFILFKIEHRGFKLSTGNLAELSQNFASKINEHQTKIFALAGEEFNIASPKQLGVILYDKLGLTTNKKSSKTKAKSTSVEVLEEFAQNNIEIASEILKWRHFSKLKSTYTDALVQLVDQNSRIHTNFSATTTSTSRLSSSNPNLQNIPVRSEEGDQIRKSFIAEEGNLLISADYSQIELRLLAHMGNVKTLQEAFEEGKDIHQATAMEVFSLKENEVTAEYRRKAKTINFGIIYGISAFGLAERLNITRSEAKIFIEKYFEKFPEIKNYMESTIEFCKTHSYVETIYGRKLYFPNINNNNPMLKSFTERAVINAPLQGSAADIVKKAMISTENKLSKSKLKIDLILQVHDELIYEVAASDCAAAMEIIKSEMENSTKLSIPLKVEANSGHNWQEIH